MAMSTVARFRASRAFNDGVLAARQAGGNPMTRGKVIRGRDGKALTVGAGFFYKKGFEFGSRVGGGGSVRGRVFSSALEEYEAERQADQSAILADLVQNRADSDGGDDFPGVIDDSAEADEVEVDLSDEADSDDDAGDDVDDGEGGSVLSSESDDDVDDDDSDPGDFEHAALYDPGSDDPGDADPGDFDVSSE